MDRKKELICAYKETPTPMGVYQIKNLKNGKIFIGSHTNIPGKINSNRFQLTHGSHLNKELLRDWQQYGADAFTFDTLELIDPAKVPRENWREAVAALEEKWLDKLRPYDENGYNVNKEKK